MSQSSEINACSFDQWYPRFRKLNRTVTLKSTIIPLDESFISYLKQDGVFLPRSLQTTNREEEDTFSEDSNAEYCRRELEHFKKQFNIDVEQEDNGVEEEEEDREQEEEEVPEFPQIQNAIQECIDEYEGAVFPKLNWSCPRDAQWILSESKLLKCTTVADVFLVLKSSQFIVHDLENAYANVMDNGEKVKPVLVCRKWYDLEQSMEFRCFVKSGNLVAISQRNTLQYFEFLKNERYSFIETLLKEFWNEYIRDIFPLSNYTVDLYIQRNKADLKKSRVFIVDFNVYAEPTNPLLFESWDNNVLSLSKENIESSIVFRLVENTSGTIRPSYRSYGGIPGELYDPNIQAEMNSEEIEKMKSFFKKSG